MMDFHILIVIACVFLASFFSLLFINKFFRHNTFEESIPEKKALNEKIHGQNKSAAKKPKKTQQQLKKEIKREKKKLQKEQQKDTTEQEDSDAQSEKEQQSGEEEASLSKAYVEFELDPEIITPGMTESIRRASIQLEKEALGINVAPPKVKAKKEKKGKTGILVNKNEPVALKESISIEEPLNTFDVKPPKDAVELKKQEKERKEEKHHGKKDKSVKKEKEKEKEKHGVEKVEKQSVVIVEQSVTEFAAPVAKELKQQNEKTRQGSPKSQQSGNNNNVQSNNNNNSNKDNNSVAKASKQQNKKHQKESAATKELVTSLDKLSENDTIGVSLLMNLFRRAELNRSEIQILIDYLLNKQQDMPSTHSEWSDDVCQKLKRQLEEKERALVEEQEASSGIQAKLRELRTEINLERAQMNVTIKAYKEKIQAKEQEIIGLNQELQNVTEKMNVELQQFQAKLLREQQNGSQDLVAQLQRMQQELGHKDKCIADLTHLVNTSHQVVEELKQQVRTIEQQRDELESECNKRIFELEKMKSLETENGEYKVEICNLQNALESYKADLANAHKDLENTKSDLNQGFNFSLNEKQNEINMLCGKNDELQQQLASINNITAEQSNVQSSLQVTLDALSKKLSEKEQQLVELTGKNSALLSQLSNAQQNTQQQQELQKIVDSLKADVAGKHKQLQEAERNVEKLSSRENELLQQLREQEEKNNGLRIKNWKLIEAYQNAEKTISQNKNLSRENATLVQQQQLLAASQKPATATATTTANATTTTTTYVSDKDDKHVREIFQRLYPDAVEACAATALTVSFEQWVANVLATQVKLASKNQTNATSSSHKSTQSNSSHNDSNNHNSTHNSHTINNLLNNNSNSRPSSSNSSSSAGHSSSSEGGSEAEKLSLENAQLRAKIDELTKLVTKTSNVLSEIEDRAIEEEAHWKSVVRSKEEQISMLKHSNGEQDI